MELLPLLGVLLVCGVGSALLPPSELQQLSAAGSKYIDSEVENAINGVKQMKTLMDKTSKDHQALLHTLEETRRRKEEAVRLARQKEQELEERQGGCNETLQELWERCKPCLKQSCLRFYSRTCHSGAGLVGRQLEEFLNRSSPFSLWLGEERVESLLEREQRQERELEELEERFGILEDGIEELFQDGSRTHGRLFPFFQAPFGGFRESLRPPVRRVGFPQRFSRDLYPFFQPHSQQEFRRLFQPLLAMTQRMLQEAHGSWERSLGEFGTGADFWDGLPAESRNFSNDRMVCKEIRRNSAGCLRMREGCEHCRDILQLDCGQGSPLPGELREELQDALRVAERFSRRYDALLGALQAELLNTTGLLQELSRQLGWVSRLANLTQGSDRPLQVTTILSKTPNPSDPSAPPETQVTVQLFDSEPLALTVPGNIPWDDPKFMELVAEQALRLYRENTIE